jgi:hypothetical protein
VERQNGDFPKTEERQRIHGNSRLAQSGRNWREPPTRRETTSVDSEAGGRDDGPVTIKQLADLQAGLLDDRTVARLRRRARTEPGIAGQLAALDRVRRDLADLGTDSASAPDIPADVTARIGSALRSRSSTTPLVTGNAPTARSPGLRPRHVAAGAGVLAIVAAAAVGTTMLLHSGSGGPTTGSPSGTAPGGLPLSDGQLLALLDQPPDLGALADPQRRVSCLGALGYPRSTSILGARPLDVDGRSGVLMLLPDDVVGRIDAVVVAPNCSAIDTGQLASRVVGHP